MVELSNQSKWKPWMAFVLEAVVIVLLLFVGSRMQMAWGITGLILTELMLLAVAIVTVVVYKTPVREVFPIKIPTIKEIVGLIILAIAGMMANLICLGFSFCIVPTAAEEITGVSQFLYSETGFLASVLIVAVLPAICEEAVHRGVILSHLRSLKKDWVIILIMGCFFGLFHLSALRFLSTAWLGILLSYVMVKKNNFLFPVLLHFFNNFISTLFGSMSGGGATEEVVMQINGPMLLGSYCVIGFLAPVLLVVADSLICPKLHKKHWVITILMSIALLVIGIICTLAGMK